MNKNLKAFITRDDFITPELAEVAPIYELSHIGKTYSSTVKKYHTPAYPRHTLYAFKIDGSTSLTEQEVNAILNVIHSFTQYLTTTISVSKQQDIVVFTNNFNSANTQTTLSSLNYNTAVTHNNVRSVDYLTFTIVNVNVSLWLSDLVFRTFYPEYDIKIVLPFENFNTIVRTPSNFIDALDSFDLVDFNRRVEENKNNVPTTYSSILNIPYRIPNTNILKNCYFGFNIYGAQANYEHILKLDLYDRLVTMLNNETTFIESIFPSILRMNEFFITPRWERIGISSQIGQSGINTQINSTFNEIFDTPRFIPIVTDSAFIRTNTYNVPFIYNNMLLQITNGMYTEDSIRNFKNYFSDLIAVNTTHPDFNRMSTRTQRFVTVLKGMLEVGNAENSTELFNNVIRSSNIKFTITTRANITYVSHRFEQHHLYLIPKYQFETIFRQN